MGFAISHFLNTVTNRSENIGTMYYLRQGEFKLKKKHLNLLETFNESVS